MPTIAANTLTLAAFLALSIPAGAEPRRTEGVSSQPLVMVADSSAEKRSSRRQTRSIFSLGPNVPEDAPGDEVASRQGKSSDTAGAAAGTPAPGGESRASGSAPVTRGLKAR